MLDPTLIDRLAEEDSKLSLDALEYIDLCHQLMIAMQCQLIERNAELLAARERTIFLNRELENRNGFAQKIPVSYGGFV